MCMNKYNWYNSRVYDPLKYKSNFRGSDTEVQGCNGAVCTYPRASCCNGFTKALDRVARSYYCSQV